MLASKYIGSISISGSVPKKRPVECFLSNPPLASAGGEEKQRIDRL
jgi:hypothetical protein